MPVPTGAVPVPIGGMIPDTDADHGAPYIGGDPDCKGQLCEEREDKM